ncbi:MAG: hypothetical protein JNJ47_00415 [Alphaproteobacteria bacterium]|nr:hypothetical protein [Alphaproteobacteria bacterium]
MSKNTVQNTSFLKKLKLAFLASGIFFSPKAGHTMMKPEDEKPPAGKQAPSASGFNSLLPAGSSNPFPASKAASKAPDLSPLYQDIQHNIFDVIYRDPYSKPSFSPSKPLILEEGIVPAELQNRKDAILTLISLIRVRELDSSRAITSREEESQNISNLIVQAFQLSAVDIQKKLQLSKEW